MRAVIQDNYGPPSGLELREIETPTVGEGDVLIRVRAAGLHAGDCLVLRGAPFLVRLDSGLLSPKLGVPGFDAAGVVEEVGTGVTDFQAGDEVFGAGKHTCADYACIPARTVAKKPEGLSFEEAAAIPTSGLAALHGLRDVGRVQAGQRVLINGASGGVGSFAVQIAKSFGAEVTGTCSERNVDLVRSLGADHAIDYAREDFASGGPQYDLILDNVENRPLADCRRALKPQGTLILNSGTGASGVSFFIRLLKPLLLSPFSSQKLRRYLSLPNRDDLQVLAGLVESGALRPILEESRSLEETAAALAHIETGHARGKVVITL